MVIINGEYPPGVFFPKRSKNFRPLRLPGENFRTPYFPPQKFNTPYSASNFQTPYFPSQKFDTPYSASKIQTLTIISIQIHNAIIILTYRTFSLLIFIYTNHITSTCLLYCALFHLPPHNTCHNHVDTLTPAHSGM